MPAKSYLKGRILLFLILPFFFLNCTSQMNTDQALEQKLDSVFATIFTPDAPGGSIFIQQGDKVLYAKSFGLSDMEKKLKYTSATVQNLGSISKTFVSYGILILAKEDKLSLDDPILKYFPDFKNKDIAKNVTIKHLLTHTSGLPDLRETERDSVFYLTAMDAENWAPIKLADSLNFEPGSQYQYSNPAYNALALIIEKASGNKWQDFIKKRIFEPAGMGTSDIQDGAHPAKNVAHGYRKINGQWDEYDYGEYPTFAASGNGGVWSSIDDLRKYADAVKKNLIVDAETFTLSTEPWKPENWKNEAAPWKGMAWFKHPSYLHGINPEEQYTVIEHSGDQGGFRAHLLMIPESDITIIWLTNNEQLLSKQIWGVMKELGYLK
jgi:CubicO group peptidase (beta-lactamase class C family)